MDLVGGIDRGDGVLAVLDGGDGRFQHHVLEAGCGHLPDRVCAVDLQFDVQAVAGKQHGQLFPVLGVAGELVLVGQGRYRSVGSFDGERRAVFCLLDTVLAYLQVMAGGQRRDTVQQRRGLLDDFLPAHRVEGTALLATVFLGDHVGSV